MAAPDIHQKRRMLSLTSSDAVRIIRQVPPGQNSYGICMCCHAPSCCWCLSLCVPCCKLPKDVLDTLEDSKYLWVRENSIEWNDPGITFAKCTCFIPVNPCALTVVDNVRVLYYDDPTFDHISNKTRCCNGLRSWCCGGRGQRVRIAQLFCCDMCLVGKDGVCCCPICLPDCCTRPYTMQNNLYVADADNAVYEIKTARANAKARMDIK